MSKQFWAIVAVIVVVLVGIFLLTGNKSDSSNKGNTNAATNHVMGEGSTGVKLVEYGDYQCVYCQAYDATVKQVVEEYKNQITFQFVNFPLTSPHPNAFAAARAAEAADKQGKFWEMHDLLYQENDPSGKTGWVASASPITYFTAFAKQLGLNEAKFKSDFASIAVNNAINADMAKGNKAGVDSTPTFFVDGKKKTINNTVEDFKKVLDEAIKDKSSTQQ